MTIGDQSPIAPFSWDCCVQIFPMTLALSENYEILRVSDALRMRLGRDILGRNLKQAFTIIRPRPEILDADIATLQKQLFLFHSNDLSIALRSQLVIGELDDKLCFMLVGSPWINWMSTHAPEVSFDSFEFPVHDSQLDLEFYISTQQSMLEDLEEQTQELRKARDLAQSGDRTKSDFVSHISHEMRTPLNGIISGINLLKKEELAEHARNLVDITSSSASTLLAIINEVLDFSKIGVGAGELDIVDFCPQDLVESTALMLAMRAREKGISVATHFTEDLPKATKGDVEKIKQVLVNFIGNAIKFSTGGSIDVRLINKELNAGVALLRFEVQDEGKGIADEDHDRVFEPFWCKSSGLASNESSTGLGLSICSQLIESMSGQVGFTSRVGKGSTFWFEIGLELSEASDIPSNDEGLHCDVKEVDARILLVDDNEVNVTLASLLLKRYGVQVVTASNGLEALNLVRAQDYDLVFMDITMPVMNGTEATVAIRKFKSYASLPIIALTANVWLHDKDRYLQAGMNDCLLKPIIEEDMLAMLARWLPESRMRRASAKSTLDSSRARPALPLSPSVVLSTEVGTLGDSARTMAANDDHDPFGTTLDVSILHKLYRDVGAGHIQLVIDQFFEETERRMMELRRVYDAKLIDEVTREAHTLGSSVLGFGALDFGNCLRDIEQAGKKQDWQSVKQHMSVITALQDSALQAIKRSAENPEHAAQQVNR